ncbi:hypothetical protein IQ07DRAFT_623772 [Pyrenochaeta sp. DS3sAY3a]|nr:hypothetical protein IQ07DRAFT_623772 [Pyrenochaeta sp. DS3sAY3a]
MEEPQPLSTPSRKRSLEDQPEPIMTTPVKAINSAASSPLSVLSRVPTPSPVKSSAPALTPSQPVSAPSNAQNPAKKRKLTQKEKDDQLLEKEAKAKARAEKKAQKEAEDKVKAEQKAQRDEEKRKKNEERDEKKRLKEEEQQQKEEEKAKRERAQMRLNAFFVKPKATDAKVAQAAVESTQSSAAPSISLFQDASRGNTNATSSPQKAIVKNARSDYERFFLPFNLAPHTILASRQPLMEDPAKLEAAQKRLEDLIAQGLTGQETVTLDTLLSRFPNRGPRGYESASIAEVIRTLHGSSDRPIDLTNEQTPRKPNELLNDISMKYIHFDKDVRPAYYGTYTKPYTPTEAAKFARNPISRIRRDTDYDYDSEAEWDEPEEGEDIGSEGEEDLDEDAGDDMEEFLDDEEDPQVKRHVISGDLVPINTGLCWEDENRVSKLNDGSGAICTDFKDFRMGFLFETHVGPIDPFSTTYWAPETIIHTTLSSTVGRDATHGSNATMNPPRAPLQLRTGNGLLNTISLQNSTSGSASKPAKAKRLIPNDQLPAFKAEIEGQDLTKLGMVEALKKAFPKLPKDAITNTLSLVAARVGPTEKEKRWVLINQ